MTQSEQEKSEVIERKEVQEKLAHLPDQELVGRPLSADMDNLGMGDEDMMMEFLRRLKKSIDSFNTTTTRLTWALLFLTVVLLGIEVGRIFSLF